MIYGIIPPITHRSFNACFLLRGALALIPRGERSEFLLSAAKPVCWFDTTGWGVGAEVVAGYGGLVDGRGR